MLNGVNYIEGDISKNRDLNRIKKNYNYVVNLGGHVDHTNKIKTLKSHFYGTKNLVKFFFLKKK